MRKRQTIAGRLLPTLYTRSERSHPRSRRPGLRFSLLGLFSLLTLIAIALVVCSAVAEVQQAMASSWERERWEKVRSVR